MITDDNLRKSVILPDMERVELGSVQSRGNLVAQDELCLLQEVVDNGENEVESVGEGKISDEVHVMI